MLAGAVAAAGQQREHDGRRGVEPAPQVGAAVRHRQGVTVGVADAMGGPAGATPVEGVCLVAAVRPLVTEDGHRGQDDAWVDRSKRAVVEAEGVELLGQVVVDDDVAGSDEVAGDVAAGGLGQVERGAELAPVEEHEEAAGVGIGARLRERPVPARRVAGARRLDLDDFRAVVAEQPRPERRGDVVPKLQYADAAQNRRRQASLSFRKAERGQPSTGPTGRASSAAGAASWVLDWRDAGGGRV